MAVQRSGGEGPFPLRIGHGARAVEAELLAELGALVEAGVREPRLLRRPVRVVVPSRSLRGHLAAAMLRRFGRAIAGVSVQTLRALAREIVERGGGRASRGDAVHPVLVRRFAREEPALREPLDELIDGYGLVADDVTDLLDAGFEVGHTGALDEALAELAQDRAAVARARAVVRVAARTLEAMEGLSLGHSARLLASASEFLRRDADGVCPARAVFVHGFAEATGVLADLLEALARHRGARVHLDEPRDPAKPCENDAGVRFTERLRSRLEGIAGVERAALAVVAPAAVSALEAPGAHAEVRAVAERIRGLLDAGRRPESIAVVARDIAGYRAPLRLHFRRLGIPFSGVGESGSVGATSRLAHALLDLLRRGVRTPADRWLDSVLRFDAAEGPDARSDLRLGLRHLGAVCLGDVAEHELAPRDIVLSAIGCYRTADADEELHASRPGARVLRRGDLERAVAAAARAQRRLRDLHAARRVASYRTSLEALLTGDLGWDRAFAECAPVFEQIDDLGAELPSDLELDHEEFLLLLGRALERVGSEPIGGSGGGVQVLSVMEARARTFDDLFLLGLNRDVFPRAIHQDPLLPDFVRRAMAVVLPDLPIKSTGYDEERYLFAQLLSASPRVTLSWQFASDDGKDCAASTLVQRLRRGTTPVAPIRVACGGARQPNVGAAAGARASRDATLWTTQEHLVRAGLSAPRREFAAALPVACEALSRALPPFARVDRPAAAAKGRLAVLGEFASDMRQPASLGPYFGFVGAPADARDPRRGPLYITTAENLARCSWQTFVRRLLRVEPPADPLEALPGTNPRLLGLVVHQVLAGIVRAVLGEAPPSLTAARARRPLSVRWPASAVFEAQLSAAATAVLEDEEIGLRGLERVLAIQALPLLERARALDWSEEGAAANVIGAELEGEIELKDDRGEPREIRFRADRIDVVDGALLLTDYKTGRPISTAVKQATRDRHLLQTIARGQNLQAVAYALAAGGEQGTGRFLFLRPDIPAEAATVTLRTDAREFIDAFESSLRSVLNAWDAGAFFPRLVQSDLQRENDLCERCEVAEACLRGDTGARQRLVRWVEARHGTAAEDLDPPQRAWLELWRLDEAKPPDSGGGRG